ncbi:hypothetical protein CcrKarma_gp080 [Caulobacter virus Karma]|uniref:Uncharacterized protein n=1 Tax=Caulobacter phage CcrSwift TaxID=2927984 RepID=K4JVJ4_9CAUD|nr:hypothetical protein CcrMagneto_gp077 [Caulobacter virus Magneto]YP_006989460.1 hypothetical protein CcrKarma_gp080 [Caulobacter virus Karma]YP_006989810.1 hypothetical protein D870_gp077 [Caulobacter phage CcrSwift]ARB13607.1 hypothetical protein Ccr10_gp079 [Caulobacter phage Ccr10]ARB13953.1 hypothetical protein Ccr2_gp078 [Caulobacter phage Ccr2]ARB14296.1 hypothetical protein Ccr5_gp078 [Caulobacter phage Ccr5]ARB14644.1 hypothetical protein Ccr29_gp087 [Caulobacter phage Ccr29]AFU87
MAELVRIYHPETNEPFDVIPSTAERLRLGQGLDGLVWLSQPFSRAAAEEPAPEAPKGRGRKRVAAPVSDEAEDDGWRDAPTEDASEAA